MTNQPRTATPPDAQAPANQSIDQLAPGVTIECRDEEWLVTNVARSTDGYRIRARGVSEFVRDTTATFYTALDDVRVFDPANVTVKPDESPHFRHTRLWLESTMRRTPVPLYQERLEVATRMLADPLDYQEVAVKQALASDNIRPRILLADTVGLGKTLEIGMILSELIRRGRGERILVVTPKHVMEQFQQELWTRFAIPLVRLDSAGIQKVRQKLPASKNPFTFFPRAIVSMDTLKSPKYRAQLEKVRWDAVVIDEIHNATNAGSQNNALARTLAPTTESLILASATPHNGRQESFKEILRLLDPLTVAPNGEIDTEAAKKLIIRRHRNSPEVKSVVGEKWAQRAEPKNIPIEASDAENAVAKEIAETWIEGGLAKDRLFPWTLVKAFLSSPAALAETLQARRANAAKAGRETETAALDRLIDLNSAVTAEESNKFAALVDYLQEIGVKKGSPRRAVIFSERVPTLHWLEKNLTKYLKLPKGAIKVMHGGMPEEDQLALIDEFKRADTPLRILVTGDVASEGVNLHAQCHDLVHYDIPWSLIRIQQRNGRIDRYGQTENPQITALLLDPKDETSIGELHVLARLIDRENQANTLLGEASLLMGKHTVSAEEDEIRKVLSAQQDFDDAVKDPRELINRARTRGNDDDAHGRHAAGSDADAENTDSSADSTDDILALLMSLEEDSAETTATTQPDTESRTFGRASLYRTEQEYLEDALNEAFHEQPDAPLSAGGVGLQEHDNDTMQLTPLRDLQRRFDYLPQDYVEYRHISDNLMLATSTLRGNEQLRAAREGDSQKSWPKAHFLGPLHPVTDWAADRALAAMERSEIPAILGDVEVPTVFLMGTLTNSRGQVVTRAFLTTVPGPFGVDSPEGIPGASVESLPRPYAWLRDAGLDDAAINPGHFPIPDEVPKFVAESVAAADDYMDIIRAEAANEAQRRTDRWLDRKGVWQQELPLHYTPGMRRSNNLIAEEEELLRAMMPERVLVRPLCVILPRNT